jgi:hypothetical protein
VCSKLKASDKSPIANTHVIMDLGRRDSRATPTILAALKVIPA